MSEQRQGAQARHQAWLDQGRFMIQRCAACGQHVYFPREVCPHCGASDPAWVEPSGAGTVYSVTVVRRKPEAGGDYNVCLIDLDEGVRLMSRVEQQPADAVQVGQRVKARVLRAEGQGGWWCSTRRASRRQRSRPWYRPDLRLLALRCTRRPPCGPFAAAPSSPAWPPSAAARPPATPRWRCWPTPPAPPWPMRA